MGGSACQLSLDPTAESVPTPKDIGTTWSWPTIRTIVWNPLYWGKLRAYRWKLECVKGQGAVMRPRPDGPGGADTSDSADTPGRVHQGRSVGVELRAHRAPRAGRNVGWTLTCCGPPVTFSVPPSATTTAPITRRVSRKALSSRRKPR